nr:hypothetical protein [Tanacetum cinerariifolium]
MRLEQLEPWVGPIRLNQDLGNKTIGPEWPVGPGCRVRPVGTCVSYDQASSGPIYVYDNENADSPRPSDHEDHVDPTHLNRFCRDIESGVSSVWYILYVRQVDKDNDSKRLHGRLIIEIVHPGMLFDLTLWLLGTDLVTGADLEVGTDLEAGTDQEAGTDLVKDAGTDLVTQAGTDLVTLSDRSSAIVRTRSKFLSGTDLVLLSGPDLIFGQEPI